MSTADIGENFIQHVVFKTKQREKLADEGHAMPDGSFPIRNVADLKRAIQAYGRASDKPKAMRWIKKRAKDLNAEDELPESWRPAMRQSVIFDADALEHHGVKGQKWGVRRAAKKSARADKKWQKNIYSVKGAVAIHNATADRVNAGIDALNARHPKANIIDSPDSPATKKYLQEYESLVASASRDAVASVHGTSPSGTLRARIDMSNPEQWTVKVDKVDATHAADTFTTLIFNVDVDSNGLLSDLHMIKDTNLQQSTLIGEEFLDHHGVKGQKWGVRKRRNESARAKAFGGGSKTRFKDAKVKTLSEDEINKRIKRLELEKKYSELNKSQVKAGKDYASGILSNSGKAAAGAAVGTGVSFLVGRALKKRFGG